MQEWEPLLKQATLEPFVDEQQSQSIVGAVFTSIGLMVAAGLLAMLFYWSYGLEKTLFIAIFSGLMFLFAIKMLVLVVVLRKKLNTVVFRIYVGSTVFVSILTLFNIIFFSIRASQRLRGSSSSSSYAPAPAYGPTE